MIDNLQEIQDFLYHVPAFPYLWIPHCLLMSLALRSTLGASALDFARQNPLSCFMRAMLYTYPGGIMSALLLCQPPFEFLTNTPMITTMIVAWYLVFFCPFDLFFKTFHAAKLGLPFFVLSDFLRLHLCLAGVTMIQKVHPTAFIYMVFFAVIKSSGFMVLKYAEHAMDHGLDKPFVVPNYPTKTCVLASVAFAASANGLVGVGMKPLLAGLTLWAVNLRLMALFTHDANGADPYDWFERLTCGLVFGNASTPTTSSSPSSTATGSSCSADSVKASKKVILVFVAQNPKVCLHLINFPIFSFFR